jgi:hypothetical protein
MTVERSTDAPSTPPPPTWKTIDWPHARQEVRRLQMRIAKATQAGQHRKAQALQWVLTHSRSAKFLAVHRVTACAYPASPHAPASALLMQPGIRALRKAPLRPRGGSAPPSQGSR